MSEAVVYEQLDHLAPAGGIPQSGADLRRLSDVPMEASVEIGRTSLTVGETLQLHPGAIVILDRLAGEPVDLLVNGTLIARGEVVVVDDQFGLRVSEIVEDDRDGASVLSSEAALGHNASEPSDGRPAAPEQPSDAPADRAPAGEQPVEVQGASTADEQGEDQ